MVDQRIKKHHPKIKRQRNNQKLKIITGTFRPSKPELSASTD